MKSFLEYSGGSLKIKSPEFIDYMGYLSGLEKCLRLMEPAWSEKFVTEAVIDSLIFAFIKTYQNNLPFPGSPDKVIDEAYAKVEADRSEMIQRVRKLDILSGDPLAFFDALLVAEDFDDPDTDIIGKKFMFAVYLELWQEIIQWNRRCMSC